MFTIHDSVCNPRELQPRHLNNPRSEYTRLLPLNGVGGLFEMPPETLAQNLCLFSEEETGRAAARLLREKKRAEKKAGKEGKARNRSAQANALARFRGILGTGELNVVAANQHVAGLVCFRL